jgi:hypothetical protein
MSFRSLLVLIKNFRVIRKTYNLGGTYNSPYRPLPSISASPVSKAFT